MQLRKRQQRPARSFGGQIGQGLGERSAQDEGWQGQLARSGRLAAQSGIERQGGFQIAYGLLKVPPKQMDPSKCEETSGFQFLVLDCSCQGERLLSMRQGARWVLPHLGWDLSQIPRRFRQRFLILTGLSYLEGLPHARLSPRPIDPVRG